MSISNLFSPNDYDLFCDNLTANSSTITTFNTTTVNATTVNAVTVNSTTDNTNVLNYLTPAAAYSSPLSGKGAGQGTVTGFITRVGKTATLQVNSFSAPLAGAGGIIFSTVLPFLPRIATNIPINVIDSGANVSGTANIDATGLVTLFVDFNTGFNAAVVVCGWNAFSITYLTV